MSESLMVLLGSAASLGFVHTLLGPDHYLPFVVLARARGWSTPKTIWITALCGAGHVGSSVVLGTMGIALGYTLRRLEAIQSHRSEVAAWLLIGFGLAYASWGLVHARRRPHSHAHSHLDGRVHAHTHDHRGEHAHPHDGRGRSLTPWVLFMVFVLGPCELLIPLLMFPAIDLHPGAVAMVAAVFGGVTIATMVGTVLLLRAGLGQVAGEWGSRYAHAAAGAVVFLCGLAIRAGL